ncbi:L-seryl-tRNA(Sec) selenium transferase, partial [Escherichia coli]|nr:L-seryl-tRNA(Sec) selenium transferase [Escherichia coli]
LFSGDKLLGGPQSGIIAGRSDLVARLRRNPLYRALRVDKVTCAALEATLAAYQKGTHLSEIPTLRMLSATKEELHSRAVSIADKIRQQTNASV